MKKNYSRYEFLKALGFTGPALMAVLSSCSQNEDFNVAALVVNANGEVVPGIGTTQASTPSPVSNPTTGGTTGSTTGGTTTSPSTINALFKVDLNSTAAKNLKTAGGYIVVNNAYVVGKTTTGNYVAASVVCTHEPKRKVILNKTEFYCTEHGARFSLTGQTLNTVTRTNLRVYKTQVDGTTLLVY